MTQDLIEKLMISKKIMDRHKSMPRGNASEMDIPTQSTPMVENFNPVQASYNIPDEFSISKPAPTVKKETSKEKIMSSKLPDSIKRLMMEHPITTPQQSTGPVLTDDLVERASRLMNKEKIYEQSEPKKQTLQSQNNSTDLKSLIKETMEEILRENGLIIENVQKSNDVFSFRVGNHIFEGKVTKIKKVK